MQHTNNRNTTFAWLTQVDVVIVLLILVVITSLQLAPTVIDQGRDSGIFAYTGQVIYEGGLPYRDAWDNKPPGVYYINALAFAIFGPGRWAVWLIETTFVFLAGLAIFWLLDQVFERRLYTWIGALMFVLLARHPALVSDTNFTEVYALLPQVLVFIAGYQFMRRQRYSTSFLIGLAASMTFLMKQTTIGVALMFIPALLLSGHPVTQSLRRWKLIATTILGGLIGLGVVALYLLMNGVLWEAIDATFVSPAAFHNWVSKEAGSLWDAVWQTLTDSVVPLVVGPLLPFLLVGVLVSLRRGVLRIRKYPNVQAAADAGLFVWATLTFLADLVLTNPTNRAYEHYYVTLLPALVLLTTRGLAEISGEGQSTRKGRLAISAVWVYLTLAIAVGPVGGAVVRLWIVDWEVTGPIRNEYLADYVVEHTAPEDNVLVWGATTAINFQADRPSPTQYHYGYPLIVPDYTSEVQIDEIVDDLEANQPRLIIDTTMIDGDRIPPLDADRRRAWWATGGRQDVADLTPVYDFVANHCTIIETIDQTAIYECTYG